MLINKQAVKQYVHEQGYQISKEGMLAVDRKVMVVLTTAIKRLGGQKTITDIEILA